MARAGSTETSNTGELTKSTQTLREFSDIYFKDFKYLNDANLIYDHEAVRAKYKHASAFTTTTRIDRKYNVLFANEAFRSDFTLFLTMGHEYVHVAQLAYGLTVVRALFEYGSYQWEKEILSNSGVKNSNYYSYAQSQQSWYLNNNKTINHMKLLRAAPSYYKSSWGLPTKIPAGVK